MNHAIFFLRWRVNCSRTFLAVWVLACLCAMNRESRAGVEAMEIGPNDTGELPHGKEADGIIGDFLLRNEIVTAVISHNAHLRRANMSTFYGASGITPGCLYDLTLREFPNDQITIFAPANQRGAVSYVRLVPAGDTEMAAVESVTTAAGNWGLFKRHEYQLRPGWHGIRIVTTWRNESDEAKEISTADLWTRFASTGTYAGIHWADAVDPADKAGYAYALEPVSGEGVPPESVRLDPGETFRCARFLAVDTSPAAAVGRVAARLGGTGNCAMIIVDEDGGGVPNAVLEFRSEGNAVPAYPNAEGVVEITLPPADHEFELRAPGRPAVTGSVAIRSATQTVRRVVLDPASALAFEIRDAEGRDIPCKIQIRGRGDTPTPDLGPPNRAHGCRDQYHSESGSFRVAVPPGTYRITVTRGIEYDHIRRVVTVQPGETTAFPGTLTRVVDTTGYISADFHNHSTPSGDNTCGTDDRIINLAAEHIEFAPTTEHNRLYDWAPHIERLGLQTQLATIRGIELTGSGTHFNAFPFQPKPYTQDWGAPVWNPDPRITAITLRDWQGADPNRWVQINHPDMVDNFLDRNADGRIDGGYLGLGAMIDALETQNGNRAGILAGAPYYIARSGDKESVRYIREFIWLQMLNRGAAYWAVAVSDAHSVYGNGVGGWRCYLPSSTDQPARVDWRELSRNAKAGRITLTTGPFLEVATSDGTMPGGLVRANAGVRLHVRVQTTTWIQVDRIQILVNGRPRPSLNFTPDSHPDWFHAGVLRFDRTIEVPLQEDSHLIAVAYGENHDLAIGFGTSPQANLHPCAYNNPIFVDIDGGGFTPNGDTLGFPLPTKKLGVDFVRAQLAKQP